MPKTYNTTANLPGNTGVNPNVQNLGSSSLSKARDRVVSSMKHIVALVFTFIDWVIQHMSDLKESFINALITHLPQGRVFDNLIVRLAV